jgi:hypothetical protein
MSHGPGPVPEGSQHVDQVNIESGVNVDGEPFCRVEVMYSSSLGMWHRSAYGQLTVAEVRQTALDWLAIAEAAEHDSMVFRFLTENEIIDKGRAAMLLGELRQYRADR